jgi:hypothetical protein
MKINSLNGLVPMQVSVQTGDDPFDTTSHSFGTISSEKIPRSPVLYGLPARKILELGDFPILAFDLTKILYVSLQVLLFFIGAGTSFISE